MRGAWAEGLGLRDGKSHKVKVKPGWTSLKSGDSEGGQRLDCENGQYLLLYQGLPRNS